MLVWSEHLSTGDPQIDQEHQEIFRRMNELSTAINCGANDSTLTKLVDVLLEYAHEHFQHEEKAMECARCPHHQANCRAHQRFTEKLRVWLSLAQSSRLPRSMIYDLHAETMAWIEHHIAHIDVHLRDGAKETQDVELAG